MDDALANSLGTLVLFGSEEKLLISDGGAEMETFWTEEADLCRPDQTRGKTRWNGVTYMSFQREIDSVVVDVPDETGSVPK